MSALSRFALTFSFLATVSTSAFAHRVAPPQFAQPPVAQAEMYVAPRMVDRAAVRQALIDARKANLDRFRAYQRAGTFPSNTFQGKKLNVWRDQDGHFCAAATIIRASGKIDLVDRVAEQSNFIRLADVKQGPLMDWILTSGFTQEEIAAIQEPFMPVTEHPAPVAPVVVDARMRRAEDARLRAKYRQVEKMLVRNEKRSIERAVDRLMKHPALAEQILALE